MRLAFQTHVYCGVVVLAALLVAPAISFGQSADAQRQTAAQEEFEKGVTAMKAGEYAIACQKFEAVTRMLPDGVGGKVALGECYERLGKLASAWTQFSFAYQVAVRLGQTERADSAKKRANTLKPQLATLSLLIPAALGKVPGVVVQRDGVELREPQWGTAMYVDSGSHEVVVTAPGYTTWTKNVDVLTDGAVVTETVPEKAIVRDSTSKHWDPEPTVVLDRSLQRTAGIVTTGVGVTTLVAGAIMGGAAIAAKNDSNEDGHCDVVANQCDDVGLELRNRAVSMASVSTGLFVAGAIVTAGGALIWLTAPSQTKTKPIKKRVARSETNVGLRIAPGWIALTGTF